MVKNLQFWMFLSIVSIGMAGFVVPQANAQVAMPDNAELDVYGSGWVCKRGYRRSGNECVVVTMPDNAELDVYGSGWVCSIGYKRVGNQCAVMSAEEAAAQASQRAIIAARARASSREFYIDGEKFTLSEISRKCEIYRWSENYGDVECSGSKFRVIERKCEAYFSDESERRGDIECSGSDLRPIERYCSASMYSESYGDIDC